MKKIVITKEFKCSNCGAYGGIPEGQSLMECNVCKAKDSLFDLNKTLEIQVDSETETIKGLPKDFIVSWPNKTISNNLIVNEVQPSCYAYFCFTCFSWRCIPFHYDIDPIVCSCGNRTDTLVGGCPCSI